MPSANRDNYALLKVSEDRSTNGIIGGFPERVAIGTNVILIGTTTSSEILHK